MALNIPNVMAPDEAFLKSMHEGGNMFSRLMQPMLDREHQRQAAEQFKQQMDLRKAQFARAGANSDIQRRILEEQLLGLKQRNDPMHEIKQLQMMQQMFGGGNPANNMQQQSPQQEMGEGLGMFNPEGLQEAQAMPQQMPQEMPTLGNGINMDAIKNSPIMRGYFKKHFGFDPAAQAPQTPEEKNAAALDLFKQKEAIKAKKEEKLPAAVKTLHENIIHLSPKAIDAIQNIMDKPSPFEPWGLGFIKSGQKAAHNKAVTAAAENYSKAKGWPNNTGSIEKAESILQRGKFETDHDYRNRLREYQDELRAGIKSSNEFLHPNKINTMQENQQSQPNIVEYKRVNGKLVPVQG
jgi:hypothetical protein